MHGTRFFFALVALFSASSVSLSTPVNAQEFATMPNTYHVEVRMEHWRIGSPFWSTEFTTNDFEEAELIFDLFEFALDSGELPSMLGWSWQWLATDVRIRTEYPAALTEPLERISLTNPFARHGSYDPPSYSPHQP
ncbi:hypothetical protein LOC71_17080 [Rhodopirellula sp. JC740]|uniref:Secreted protein n=1 Tax=Rhodopirellula halodulae TaxID=2894198 RepID=A0ABS8NKB0_9BACT|nr:MULTISPECIES: hypothetical protein [unclassified Rhodopirellula]MCC9643999.1 hypothetical protein [Rhodopirellula sp. JC740]MCC9657162.1 hypothetical protein [Rhodopirellula sp. JC737]